MMDRDHSANQLGVERPKCTQGSHHHEAALDPQSRPTGRLSWGEIEMDQATKNMYRALV